MRQRFASALLAAACCAGTADVGLGAPILTKAADDFAQIWKFDQTGANVNANFDEYSNATAAPGADGTKDWNKDTASTGISIADGAVVIDETALTNVLWPVVPSLTATSGYTLEYRIKVAATTNTNGMTIYGTPDGAGACAVSFGRVNGTDDGDIVNVYWASNANANLAAVAAQLKATVPADEFMTVRVAASYNGDTAALEHSLYVNDVLVGDAMARSLAAATNTLLVGKLGSSHGGKIELDYLAFETGAYAPVPEPAALSLLALAGAAALQRR